MMRLPAQILAITLAGLTLSGCATLMEQLDIGQPSQEFVSMPFAFEGDSMVWKIGHVAENGVTRITEMVRPPETVEDWSEMVTLQVFNTAAADFGDVESFLTDHEAELVSRCPGSTMTRVDADDEDASDMVLFEFSVANCAEGEDEQILGRLIEGEWNRFVTLYAVRGEKAMTAARRAEWIKNLVEMRLVAR